MPYINITGRGSKGFQLRRFVSFKSFTNSSMYGKLQQVFFFFCRTTCPNSLDQCPVIPELLTNGCLSEPSLPPSNQELIILHISRCILSVCILQNISHNASLLVFHYHFYFLFIHEFLFRFFIVVGTVKSTTTTFLIFYYVIQF